MMMVLPKKAAGDAGAPKEHPPLGPGRQHQWWMMLNKCYKNG